MSDLVLEGKWKETKLTKFCLQNWGGKGVFGNCCSALAKIWNCRSASSKPRSPNVMKIHGTLPAEGLGKKPCHEFYQFKERTGRFTCTTLPICQLLSPTRDQDFAYETTSSNLFTMLTDCSLHPLLQCLLSYIPVSTVTGKRRFASKVTINQDERNTNLKK